MQHQQHKDTPHKIKQKHSVQKNHTAHITNLNINGRESIFIPVSVGTNSYQHEPFFALAVKLVEAFSDYPNTPVYILIGDSVQAETILFRRSEIFAYEPEDFKEENSSLLEAKIKAYHVKALEIAKAEGIEWEKDCQEGIKYLRSFFTSVTVEHWEDKKSRINGEFKVKTQVKENDILVEKEVTLHGYDAKVAEFNKNTQNGSTLNSLVNAASAQYYNSYLTAEMDRLDILSKKKTLTDEHFVRARSRSYLKQDIIVLSETVKDLQDLPDRPNVCLAYPYPSGHPTQSATLRALQCKLVLSDETRGVAPRLETPEIRIMPANSSKNEKGAANAATKMPIEKPPSPQSSPKIAPKNAFFGTTESAYVKASESQEEAAQCETYRIAGEKLSQLKGADPDADNDMLLFLQFKAFQEGLLRAKSSKNPVEKSVGSEGRSISPVAGLPRAKTSPIPIEEKNPPAQASHSISPTKLA